MKAAQINAYGGPSVIEVNEVDIPTPGHGQVLVEVYASSLNPFDTAVREGYMKEMIPLRFPVTLGGDIAGIVTEVGEDVTHIAAGDKVYGQANVAGGNSGAFAEYAVTSAGQVAKSPAGLTFNQTASLPLVGVSALQALKQHIGLARNQKIFIHGGGGGIGAVAIQIAKNVGAYVATTATGDALGRVKQLGADEAIDYKTQNFAETLREYDAVFDTIGGDDFDISLSVLRKGGIAVSMAAPVNEAKTSELGVRAITQATHVTTNALNELTMLIEREVVTPHVGKVFSLLQIRKAFEAREAGGVQGKIVIEIR